MSPLPFECSLKVLFTSDDTITFRGFQINVWVNSSTTTTTTTKKPTAATAQTTPLPPGEFNKRFTRQREDPKSAKRHR
jgi:hypothetical protein